MEKEKISVLKLGVLWISIIAGIITILLGYRPAKEILFGDSKEEIKVELNNKSILEKLFSAEYNLETNLGKWSVESEEIKQKFDLSSEILYTKIEQRLKFTTNNIDKEIIFFGSTTDSSTYADCQFCDNQIISIAVFRLVEGNKGILENFDKYYLSTYGNEKLAGIELKNLGLNKYVLLISTWSRDYETGIELHYLKMKDLDNFNDIFDEIVQAYNYLEDITDDGYGSGEYNFYYELMIENSLTNLSYYPFKIYYKGIVPESRPISVEETFYFYPKYYEYNYKENKYEIIESDNYYMY